MQHWHPIEHSAPNGNVLTAQPIISAYGTSNDLQCMQSPNLARIRWCRVLAWWTVIKWWWWWGSNWPWCVMLEWQRYGLTNNVCVNVAKDTACMAAWLISPEIIWCDWGWWWWLLDVGLYDVYCRFRCESLLISPMSIPKLFLCLFRIDNPYSTHIFRSPAQQLSMLHSKGNKTKKRTLAL